MVHGKARRWMPLSHEEPNMKSVPHCEGCGVDRMTGGGRAYRPGVESGDTPKGVQSHNWGNVVGDSNL